MFENVWAREMSRIIAEAGGEVTVELGGDGPTPAPGARIVVGVGRPQAHVPADVWQRTLPTPGDALVSCMVSPGFDFADFTLNPSA